MGVKGAVLKYTRRPDNRHLKVFSLEDLAN